MNFMEIGTFVRDFAKRNDFEENGYEIILEEELAYSMMYKVIIKDILYKNAKTHLIDRCQSDEHIIKIIVNMFHEIENKRKECLAKGQISYHFNNVNILDHSSLYPTTPRKEYNTMYKRNEIPEIKEVIFNDPATIVFWVDGTKTVVKKQKGDKKFDKEKGLAMAICKKLSGNKGNFNNIFKKWGAV